MLDASSESNSWILFAQNLKPPIGHPGRDKVALIQQEYCVLEGLVILDMVLEIITAGNFDWETPTRTSSPSAQWVSNIQNVNQYVRRVDNFIEFLQKRKT